MARAGGSGRLEARKSDSDGVQRAGGTDARAQATGIAASAGGRALPRHRQVRGAPPRHRTGAGKAQPGGQAAASEHRSSELLSCLYVEFSLTKSQIPIQFLTACYLVAYSYIYFEYQALNSWTRHWPLAGPARNIRGGCSRGARLVGFWVSPCVAVSVTSHPSKKQGNGHGGVRRHV